VLCPRAEIRTEFAHPRTSITPLVAAHGATTGRLPLLLEISLLRFAVPQKDVTAIQADKVDIFEWEPRVHFDAAPVRDIASLARARDRAMTLMRRAGAGDVHYR
jgi:hypothetical protein